MRLYAPFYSSDIIIASPLGMRTVIGAEGEKNRDFDFLSSIEILIIDQADVYLMQNWEHVLVRFPYVFIFVLHCVLLGWYNLVLAVNNIAIFFTDFIPDTYACFFSSLYSDIFLLLRIFFPQILVVFSTCSL